MIVSPQIAQNGTAVANISVSKAQELPVRTNSVSAIEHEPGPKLEKGPELAEKLNEQTKKKYVKGRLNHVFNSSGNFLITSRKKAW